MNDALKLQISAFVDGELPDAEAELLTRRLGKDADLRQQAARYLEIGQLMRGENAQAGAATLRARIAAALETEPLPDVSEEAPSAPRWMRPAAGVAIAASVAVLALFGLRQIEVPDPGPAVLRDAVAVDDVGYTEPDPGALLSERPSDMLVQYYLSHGQSAGDLGANGILFSELVTLEQLVEVAPTGADADDPGPSAAPANDDVSESASVQE